MKSVSKMSMEELAAYYHWDDLQSLEQAIWVAEQNKFDIVSVEEWSQKEQAMDKFNNFRQRIEE